MQFRNMIAKLLENPLSIPILQLLTNNQLSIPQITKSLQNYDADMPTVIAVLGELYHFGFVERVRAPVMNTSTQNQNTLQAEEKRFFQDQRLISPTPLGIPVQDYVSLWEKVLQHPDQLNFSEMNRWIFSIPDYLRSEIEELTLEEIRQKLLNRGC